jgi:cobalt-zinc-cadmium resistance protein CzcA
MSTAPSTVPPSGVVAGTRQFARSVVAGLLVAEQRGRGLRLRDAIVGGCRQRLRPVLMTASLAALGLVPAALSRGIGSETQRPLAVVIVCGTVSACALTLVLLPVMYQQLARVTERVRPRLHLHRARLVSALGR